MKRKVTGLFAAVVLGLLVVGCGASTDAGASTGASTDAGASTSSATGDDAANGDSSATAEESGAITVTDMMGHEVTLDAPVEKVVALTASDCEILYALGAGDLLVGRGEFCDYPAEVMEVPAMESGAETNIEEIIAAEPDLVLMGSMAQSEEQVAALEEAGIKVAVSEATDIEGVYDSIGIIGTLLGKESEADALVNEMRDRFEELSALAAENSDVEKPTIYFEVSPLEYGLWTAGSGTFMNEVAEMIGCENLFADVEGWAEISEEQVLERNPDYIVTITMYFGEGPTPEEEIMSRAGWENVTAVKNGWILNLQNNELSRPVPRLTEGAEMLYDFIYEETALEDAA